MTLVEIMVSIGIFLVISTAMLGVMTAATSLYQQGERSRAANDEVMAVLNILDRDLTRALSSEQDGQFWAWCVDPNDTTLKGNAEPDGDCIVAWTIEDGVSTTGYSMVAWGVEGQGPTARLRRYVYLGVDLNDWETYPDDDDLRNFQGGNTNQFLVQGVLHFGAWLLSTSRNAAEPKVKPRDDYWIEVTDIRDGFPEHTEPRRGLAPYSTFDGHRYPLAIRITLMIKGRAETVHDGRVRSDDGEQALRTRGLKNVPSLRGTLARIGDELVGFNGLAGDRLQVNSVLEHGPLFDQDPADRSGRGVYRSTPPGAAGHPANAKIHLGHQISLIRQLPCEPVE